MFLSAFNIGTGASLGREEPTVQICAAIASVLGLMFAISRKRLQSLIQSAPRPAWRRRSIRRLRR